jgi:hypothetical protein
MTSPNKPIVCSSRPDCPCAFCTRVRAEMKANPRPKRVRVTQAEERELVEDFLSEYPKGQG